MMVILQKKFHRLENIEFLCIFFLNFLFESTLMPIDY